MRKSVSVGWFDRIVSAITYLTAGWGGMIILVIMYFGKKSPSHFLRFNVFQSIFISLLFFVLAASINIILQILSYIPFINYLAAQIAFLFSKPFIGPYSLIQAIMSGLIIYMCVFSFFGKYPRVFGISKIIDYAAR